MWVPGAESTSLPVTGQPPSLRGAAAISTVGSGQQTQTARTVFGSRCPSHEVIREISSERGFAGVSSSNLGRGVCHVCAGCARALRRGCLRTTELVRVDPTAAFGNPVESHQEESRCTDVYHDRHSQCKSDPVRCRETHKIRKLGRQTYSGDIP